MIRSFSQIVGAARNAAGGTVDAIVSPLAGMATDLDNKADALDVLATQAKEKARDLCNTAKAYEADASRARGIAKNIRKAFQDLGHDIQGAN